MKARIVSLSILCLFALAAADPPRHLADANLLVDNISARFNSYEHKGCYIKWKGEDGATQYENRSDCSDFLALLIEHSYGVTPQQLKQWTGHTRPLANEWHDAIANGSGFKQIKKWNDALPGDVLAVKFPPGLADTGHIMLIAGIPQTMAAKSPIVPGTRQWNVTIIDSTKSPHGPADTRLQSDGTSASGVGRGVIRIYTDNSGQVAGYCWSDGGKAKFESQSDRNMVMGRLDAARN